MEGAYIKRRITETLPTTLEAGEEIYYQDANGVQTLWVGNEDGEAWPSVGYKEIVLDMSQEFTSAPTIVAVKINQTPYSNFETERSGAGSYSLTFDGSSTYGFSMCEVLTGVGGGFTSTASHSIHLSTSTNEISILFANYSGSAADIGAGSPRRFYAVCKLYPS
jgi:hypothetical protein